MAEQSVSESKFTFGNLGIADVLAGKKYEVPTYQRPYSWSDDESTLRDQVREFWDDVSAAKVTGDEYFLGTVVVAREGSSEVGRLSIVDGQQRLATTAILLAALRDVYRDRSDMSRADVVQQDYLAKRDLKTNSEIPQIQLNGEDDSFFRSYVIGGIMSTAATRESHRDIARAYELLKGELEAIADEAGPKWSDRLAEWPEFLAEKVRVVRVEVPTEAEAFVIFETLNDRGADLTISDLLKILLFSRAGDRIESVRNSWIAAMVNLDVASEGGQVFNDFLRTYWSSKHGATRERELYSKIRDEIDSEDKAVELAEDLETTSRTYHALLNPTTASWKGYKPSTVKHLQTLLDLKLEQNRPLLLACASVMTKPRFATLTEKLVSWSVRGLIVGGIGGGTAERLYCEAAMKVWSKTARTPPQVKAEIADVVFSDSAFKSRFATAAVSRGPLARYLLYVLEREKSGVSQPELVPNEDASEVNLEHVLPQNPTLNEWPSFSAEEARAYRNRIGNMALLKESENSKIGNTSFAIKAPILAASALLLTEEVGTEADWTAAEIEARQGRLASLAVKAWKL